MGVEQLRKFGAVVVRSLEEKKKCPSVGSRENRVMSSDDLDTAALEIFRGKYTVEEIRSMLDRADILRMAFAKIEEQLQSGAP
jgi:hypothetical protein